MKLVDGCPGCLATLALGSSELDADEALGGVLLASAIFDRPDARFLLPSFLFRLLFFPGAIFSPLESLLLEYDRENGKGGGAGEQNGPRCSVVVMALVAPIIFLFPVMSSSGVHVAVLEYSAIGSFGRLGSSLSISGGVPPSQPLFPALFDIPFERGADHDEGEVDAID